MTGGQFISNTDIDPKTTGYLGLGLGHMADVPVAAFDPVFWLHHWFVPSPSSLNRVIWTDSLATATLIACLQSGRPSMTTGSMIPIRLNHTQTTRYRPIPRLQILCYRFITMSIKIAGTLLGLDTGRTWATSMTFSCPKLVSLRALLYTLLSYGPLSTNYTHPPVTSSEKT